MIPKALKIWAVNVANAAPDTPIFKLTIKNISKTILIIEAIAKKIKGILEFPRDLNNDAK